MGLSELIVTKVKEQMEEAIDKVISKVQKEMTVKMKELKADTEKQIGKQWKL